MPSYYETTFMILKSNETIFNIKFLYPILHFQFES